MLHQLDTIRKTRVFLLNLVKDLSLAQWNEIPSGYNNNIAWNLAHLVASQQGLCYTRSGNPVVIDEKFVAAYKSGSKPERDLSTEEVEEIKHLFFSTLDQLEQDYQKGIFSNYTPFTTRYQVELATIESAVEFLLFHEGLHLGYVMALRRALGR